MLQLSRYALKFAAEALRHDRDIVRAAVTQDWRALMYSAIAIYQLGDILNAAVQQWRNDSTTCVEDAETPINVEPPVCKFVRPNGDFITLDDAWGCDVDTLAPQLRKKLGIRDRRVSVEIADGVLKMKPYMVPYPSKDICAELARRSGVGMRIPTLVVSRRAY